MSAFELANVFSNVTNKLITEFEENPTLYEKIDIDTITSEGWLIKYCVFLEKMSEEDSFELIKKTLQWRKIKSFANLTDADFPKELFEVGAAFPYTQDKDGNCALVFRLDRHLSRMGKLAKKFLLHQLNKVDKMANGNNKFVVLVDYNNSQLAFNDQYLVFYLIKLMRHFPCCKYFIHYNASAVTKQLIQCTYRKSIDKFAEKKQIHDHFYDQNLPQYLGGTCTKSMTEAPKESQSIIDCYQTLGMSKKSALKHKEYLQKMISV